MSTNYYYRETLKKCECCGRMKENKEIHIGQCSRCFLFSGDVFKTYKEWKKFLNKKKDCIFNEYDEKVEFSEMIRIKTRIKTRIERKKVYIKTKKDIVF